MSHDTLATLANRSDLLRKIRAFFFDRDFLEVETPLLSAETIPEEHIDLPKVASPCGHHHWLQASPELHMKRLLCGGARAIFQITRSFRSGETGRLHAPEFTIVEWYHAGGDMQAGIGLLDELAQSLLHTAPAKRTSYAAAFESAVGVCPHASQIEDLASAARQHGIEIPPRFPETDRDEWLNLLLAMVVEPQLGENRPEIVYHFPASQAALARTAHDRQGRQVAERFELYFRGVELANGYHELTDAVELRRRLAEVAAKRSAAGRAVLPFPASLLMAMEEGMPDCAGVALGFDRLMMLAVGAESIGEVMPLPIDRPGP